MSNFDYKVQFERPVGYFDLPKLPYIKKEIDLAIFPNRHQPKLACEFKFPRNGQYPEQMFKACEDIAFLEQLVSSHGFERGCFIIAANDPLFWSGKSSGVVYDYFRSDSALCGLIEKPTGKKDSSVTLTGSYFAKWKPVGNEIKYATVVIAAQGSE